MAFKKSHTHVNGATGDYWMIAQLNLDKVKKLSHLELRLYKDQAFRESASEITSSIHLKSYDWNFSDFPFDVTQISDFFKVAYEKIKKEDEYFRDAEDV